MLAMYFGILSGTRQATIFVAYFILPFTIYQLGAFGFNFYLLSKAETGWKWFAGIYNPLILSLVYFVKEIFASGPHF